MRALCRKKFRRFADDAEVRPGAYVIGCANISIGRRVIVRPGSHLMAESPGEITIEDDVMMGAGVHIYVNNHCFEDPDVPVIDQGYHACAPVVLKRGCWVGANVVILPGVTIGANAVVGAGSVVTRSIPDRVLAAGSPARIIRAIGTKQGAA